MGLNRDLTEPYQSLNSAFIKVVTWGKPALQTRVVVLEEEAEP